MFNTSLDVAGGVESAALGLQELVYARLFGVEGAVVKLSDVVWENIDGQVSDRDQITFVGWGHKIFFEFVNNLYTGIKRVHTSIRCTCEFIN